MRQLQADQTDLALRPFEYNIHKYTIKDER